MVPPKSVSQQEWDSHVKVVISFNACNASDSEVVRPHVGYNNNLDFMGQYRFCDFNGVIVNNVRRFIVSFRK